MSHAAADKTIALVTGANRGLGREIARQLAALGLHVIVAGRDREACAAVAAELIAAGGSASAHALDVTSDASTARLHHDLEKGYGRLDVLVNNAGILPDGGQNLASLPLNLLQKTLETNLFGVLRVTQALLPLLQKSPRPRIVNLSSGLGQLADMGSGTPAYRISKTALNAVTRILAAELKGTPAKVNSICPGWCRTDMGGPEAPRTPAQGADTAVWLATLADDGPSGGFFRGREAIAW